MTERLKEFLQQKRWLQLKKTDWIAVALVGVLLLVTPLSEAAQAFVDFATSADASDLIAGAGAVPVAE